MALFHSKLPKKRMSRSTREFVHQILVWLLIIGILMISFSSASSLPADLLTALVK